MSTMIIATTKSQTIKPYVFALVGFLSACTANDSSVESETNRISVEQCDECKVAQLSCLEGGKDPQSCEMVVRECFAECEKPPVPSSCGCDEIFDKCMVSSPTDQAGMVDCQILHKQCLGTCEIALPPQGVCEKCDISLQECIVLAKDAADPASAMDACVSPYQACRKGCEQEQIDQCDPCHDQFDSCMQTLPQDAGQLEQAVCGNEYQSCLSKCSNLPPTPPCSCEGALEQCDKSNPECMSVYQSCVVDCVGVPSDCFAGQDQCLKSAGDTTTRQECDQRLESCLQKPVI